jgi:radical SAM protein with 4Fe4S-binding SPASM domain
MMHPGFFEIVEMTGGINSVLSTNGHFLNGDNASGLAGSPLSRLIVSLDGMNEQSYSRYRKQGDLRKVKDGIENVAEAIKKHNSGLKLEIQFLVNRFNEKEIPEAREFAGKINATLRLKSMQISDPEKAEEWMPGNEKFRRYLNKSGIFRIKSNLSNRCFRLWTSPVITWDGKVVPCCFDKDADHIMGDLTESTFRNIWHSDRYREFRRKLLDDRRGIEICVNCTSGLYGVAV